MSVDFFTEKWFSDLIEWPELLQVSFSGGRTSALMSYLIQKYAPPTTALSFVFSNTGLEHPDTLRFVDDCDKAWNLNLVWVEAVIREAGTGTTFKVVDYQSASRNGEPFEAVIQKYGLPNPAFKTCTKELKTRTITAYGKSVWPGRKFCKAIGIRADEPKRISPNAKTDRIVYPLHDWWPTQKEEVLDFCSGLPWDLKIPAYLGNCVTCFHKTDKKLALVYRDSPNWFEPFSRYEELYATTNNKQRTDPRTMYRGHRSSIVLIKTIQSANLAPNSRLDNEDLSPCSESCEPF